MFKPSSASPLSAVKLIEAYIDAGVPAGAINLVMGPGETVGQALQDHPGVDGIVFTGSYEVGMRLFHAFSKTWPRPCIVEMGGKNPAIVTRQADLDEAAEGIMRSAFGFGGQKCSANSRVYVERPVHDELVRRWSRRPRRSPSATRSSARTGWARSSTSGPSIGTRRRSPRRAATAPSSSAASA